MVMVMALTENCGHDGEADEREDAAQCNLFAQGDSNTPQEPDRKSND